MIRYINTNTVVLKGRIYKIGLFKVKLLSIKRFKGER